MLHYIIKLFNVHKYAVKQTVHKEAIFSTLVHLFLQISLRGILCSLSLFTMQIIILYSLSAMLIRFFQLYNYRSRTECFCYVCNNIYDGSTQVPLPADKKLTLRSLNRIIRLFRKIIMALPKL